MKQTFKELANSKSFLSKKNNGFLHEETVVKLLKQVREATIQDCLDICLGNDDTKEAYKDILKWVDKDSIEI